MEIVRTKGFDRDLKRIGVTDADFDALTVELAQDPKAGDVMQGLRGVRKIRFALPSRNIGKRGGARAIYLALEVRGAIILLKAYGKGEKSDLTPDDRKAILKFIEALED